MTGQTRKISQQKMLRKKSTCSDIVWSLSKAASNFKLMQRLLIWFQFQKLVSIVTAYSYKTIKVLDPAPITSGDFFRKHLYVQSEGDQKEVQKKRNDGIIFVVCRIRANEAGSNNGPHLNLRISWNLQMGKVREVYSTK